MTILTVKVIPNARKNSFEGFHDGALKIKIHAIADKGKANEALIEFLAATFGVAKSQIRILSGHKGRLKRVEVDGVVDLSKIQSSAP